MGLNLLLLHEGHRNIWNPGGTSTFGNFLLPTSSLLTSNFFTSYFQLLTSQGSKKSEIRIDSKKSEVRRRKL